MRRAILAGLIFTSACLGGGTAPSAVASLQISSNVSPNGVFVGDQVQLNVEPLDLQGNVVPVVVTYSSSNHTVATVSTAGLITALAPGGSSIGVVAGGQSAQLTLTVDGNTSGSVVLTPPSATIAPGQSIGLAATVITTLGNPARNRTVTWSTSDATKVSVDQTGQILGVASTAGVSVCATATDVTSVKGCAPIVVQPPAASFMVSPVGPRRR